MVHEFNAQKQTGVEKKPLLSDRDQEDVDENAERWSVETCWSGFLFHAKQPANWLVVTLLFLTTANNVIFKNIEIRMENYSYTLTQMQPVMLIPSFFILTFIRWKTNNITPEQFAFPKYRYVIMAFLFALFNFLTRFGARGNYVNGAVMVLLAQVTN